MGRLLHRKPRESGSTCGLNSSQDVRLLPPLPSSPSAGRRRQRTAAADVASVTKSQGTDARIGPVGLTFRSRGSRVCTVYLGWVRSDRKTPKLVNTCGRGSPPGLWLPDSRRPDECSGVQWGDSACTTPTAPVMRPERLPPTHRPPSRARAACCFRSRGADVSRRLRPPCPAEPPDGLAWGEAVRRRPPERKARRTATPGPPAA